MKVKMNPTREKVIEVLKGADHPMTLAEISTAIGTEVKSGSIVAMISAGMISKTGEASIEVAAKSKVKVYKLGTGSMPEKAAMTPARAAVIKALTDAETPMTLAEISAATGVVIKSGSITAMIAHGVIVADGEKVVMKKAHRKVATYSITSTVAAD